MSEISYRRHLRAVVAASAAPYAYTLTIWTAGAVAAHAQRSLPSSTDALLLLAGAVLGFGAVGTYALGSVTGVLAPDARGEVRLWGGLHLPSVELSIVFVATLTHLLHGGLLWPARGVHHHRDVLAGHWGAILAGHTPSARGRTG